MNFLRSQRPDFRLLLACGIERASEMSNAIVCSAVVIVLPSGAFITTMPRIVAAETSILSTPTPARPITRRLLVESSRSAVTLVSLRTISPSLSASASRNSAGANPVRFSTTKPAERKGANPLSLTSSATNIFVVIVLPSKGEMCHKKAENAHVEMRNGDSCLSQRQSEDRRRLHGGGSPGAVEGPIRCHLGRHGVANRG